MITKYLFLITILIFGILAIVYSWPIFLLILLTIFAIIFAWKYMPRILIFLPALIPFLPALNPSADIDLAASRVIILFLAIVGSLYIIYKKKAWFSLSTPTLLIIFFLFWSFFSFVAAEDLGRFLRKYLVFISIFPIYFLLLAFLRKYNDWQKLFKYWSWSAFFISLLGFGQFLFQFIGGQQLFFKFWGNYVAPVLYGANAGEAVASNPSWFVNISGITVLRAIGTFPDPHMLAFFLGMSLPIQIVYILKNSFSNSVISNSSVIPSKEGIQVSELRSYEHLDFLPTGRQGGLRGNDNGKGSLDVARDDKEKLRMIKWSRKSIFWALPVLSFLVLLLTFSRGSYVGLAGVAVWLAVYFWLNYPQKRQRIVIGLLLTVVFSALLPPVRDRFFSILDIYEGSNKGRLEIWDEAFGVTLKNPLFGVGLGNYANTVRPEAKYREPIYAHNTYLDLSSEIGIIGALAWIMLIFWTIKPIFYRSSFGYELAVALGILWFSLHALFETPIYSPQILPLLLVLVAFQVHTRSRINDR